MKRLKKFLQRLREWRALARNAPLLPMLKALRTGTVDLKTYRARIRACHRCPIYDRSRRACHKEVTVHFNSTNDDPGATVTLGCGCYVPFLAKTRAPYTRLHYPPSSPAPAPGGNYTLGMAPAPDTLAYPVRGCWGRATYGSPFGWGEVP